MMSKQNSPNNALPSVLSAAAGEGLCVCCGGPLYCLLWLLSFSSTRDLVLCPVILKQKKSLREQWLLQGSHNAPGSTSSEQQIRALMLNVYRYNLTPVQGRWGMESGPRLECRQSEHQSFYFNTRPTSDLWTLTSQDWEGDWVVGARGVYSLQKRGLYPQ